MIGTCAICNQEIKPGEPIQPIADGGLVCAVCQGMPKEPVASIEWIARYRGRLPKMREDIHTLTGVHCDAGILPDELLAAVCERAKGLAKLGIGDEDPMTRKAAMGFCVAIATAAVAEIVVWVKANHNAEQTAMIEDQIYKAAKGAAERAMREAASEGKKKKDPSGTIN